MNNTKQSSILWLQQALETILTHQQIMQTIGIFVQSHEMHKEEHAETWNSAIDAVQKEKWESYEQYYNETFNCIANEI
jgi:hypothetical protein